MSHAEVSNERVVSLPRRWLAVAGAAAVGIAGIVAWEAWQNRPAPVRESQPATPAIATVTALGRLEPEGEAIDLTAPTAIQESRLAELLIAEGDRVEAGQIVAVLDGRERREAALQTAEERVRVAQAELAQVRAGAKTGELQAQEAEILRLQAQEAGNLATQRAAIARLEAEVENARVEFERFEMLYQNGAVSASQRDATRLTLTTAQRQLQEAEAELARIATTTRQQIQQARATFDRIAEVRPVDVATAEAEVRSALASVAEAKAELAQTFVRSPIPGRVIKIHTRPGESIADAGIATIGQTQQMMAIADVYQNDIAKIRVGQSVKLTSPALDGTLQGTVARIGLQVEQQQVINEDPAVNIDAKVVEAQIRLDPDSSERVAGLTNLQVTATIQTK